jgi:hypothetical protein
VGEQRVFLSFANVRFEVVANVRFEVVANARFEVVANARFEVVANARFEVVTNARSGVVANAGMCVCVFFIFLIPETQGGGRERKRTNTHGARDRGFLCVAWPGGGAGNHQTRIVVMALRGLVLYRGWRPRVAYYRPTVLCIFGLRSTNRPVG